MQTERLALEQEGLKKTFLIALLSMLVILALLGSATFAWFSNNSKVGTNTATGKSGTSSLKLLIGGDESNLLDSSANEVEIQQVNSMELDKLYPVSTSDLETFCYATVFDKEGKATKYAQDEEEARYYHGKLYLRMQGANISEAATFRLYLDSSESSGGVLGQSSDGYLLNAARLGLKFTDAEPVILHFAEESKGETANNTIVGGSELGEGYVLSGTDSYTTDPSEDFSVYQLDSSEASITIPEKALATLPLNQTVELNVYFYLEGCDEDCIGTISKDQCELHLAFYAIAE